MPPLTDARKVRMVRIHLDGLAVSDRLILATAQHLGGHWHLDGFPEQVAEFIAA